MSSSRETQEEIDKLATEIRDQVGKEPIHATLSTSQRIIARVTDGIYREPWAAFRELLSNAYDADATSVVVETNAPLFNQVVVRDNGNGMTPETLSYILKSIGGSSKRTKSGERLGTVDENDIELSPNLGRPLIGKIGIGLFAVAQLTQHFQIITKSANERIRTSATVRLHTHNEKKAAEALDEEYIAGEVKIVASEVPDSELDSHGTVIVLYTLRPEIRRVLQSFNRWGISRVLGPDGSAVKAAPTYHIGNHTDQSDSAVSAVPPKLPWLDSDSPSQKFDKLVRAAEFNSGGNKQQNLDHFDEYLKVLWNLSLSLPLKYIEEHPFDFTGSSGITFVTTPQEKGRVLNLDLASDQSVRDKLHLIAGESTSKNRFEVLVDGVLLRRPINLPTELRRPSRLKKPMMLVAKVEKAFKDEVLDRAGGNLHFEAYLYWNSKIVPKDTSGVLVRVREASGTLFDENFLRYQVSEQNRLSQITAEIFVHAGLDGAINIDRESFNYSHPHFLFIQKWLHRCLRLLINRIKTDANEDLSRERAFQVQVNADRLVNAATEVWVRKLGPEADQPIPSYAENRPPEPPDYVGDSDLYWEAGLPPSQHAKATAIAVVLEAYGALRHLELTERARLITDLINVLNKNA